MSEPLVSVLLPVRDPGPYLKDCIASLRRQTLEEYEVIAVDDGSTDGSAKVLDDWAARDDRVKVVHRSESGLVETLNAGLELCTAPFVARMDADDISHPKRFELAGGRVRGAAVGGGGLEPGPAFPVAAGWGRATAFTRSGSTRC